MAGDTTTAEAEANASAMLHYVNGLHPAENPFKHYLTPEEHEKHIYFNDYILERAERRERALNPDRIDVRRMAPDTRAGLERDLANAIENGHDGRINSIEHDLYGYSPTMTARAIVRYENEIIIELANVETQYESRAIQLATNEGEVRRQVAMLQEQIDLENERLERRAWVSMTDRRREELLQEYQAALAAEPRNLNDIGRLQAALFGAALNGGLEYPEIDYISDYKEIRWPNNSPPQDFETAYQNIQQHDYILENTNN